MRRLSVFKDEPAGRRSGIRVNCEKCRQRCRNVDGVGDNTLNLMEQKTQQQRVISAKEDIRGRELNAAACDQGATLKLLTSACSFEVDCCGMSLAGASSLSLMHFALALPSMSTTVSRAASRSSTYLEHSNNQFAISGI